MSAAIGVGVITGIVVALGVGIAIIVNNASH